MKVFLFNLLGVLTLTIMSGQSVKRIEPPFWWAGMHDTTLQIMCYGKELGQYQVAVSKGKLLKIDRLENPDYLFVLLDTKDMTPGKFQLIFSRNGHKSFVQDYELKARQKQSAMREGFDASDVVYLLMPDRFSNGNPDNDTMPGMLEKANRQFDGGRHGGDIQGIINHLDYLQDLGVTTLWSTPLLEDNEPVYSYHTYAISDFYRIDPRYGTNQDYQKLARELHKRDMKLIMDFVINHWGSRHWMIQNLPDQNWVHFWKEGKNGFKRSNYRMSTQFDPYATQTDTQNCLNGWFDTTMPDMNLSDPLLKKYVIQNAIWWIEYAGLDGLRVDTYSYNDKHAIADWTRAVLAEYPNLNIVGEVWMHHQAQIAYWQKDSPVGAIQHYNSYLPSVMDFTLHDAIKLMFDEDVQGWDKGIYRAYDNFTNDFLYANPANILVFMGNHDTTRINALYQGDLSKYKLALTLILTTRGIPQLYYGDEIGMRGNKELKGDGDIRRDFPGGWQEDKQNAFEEKGRTPQQQAYFNFTKKLLQWRKKHKELMRNGKMLHYVPVNNVYVYFRIKGDEKIIVILNNARQTRTIHPQDYHEVLKQAKSGRDIISGKKILFNKDFIVPPKTPMLIEIDKD